MKKVITLLVILTAFAYGAMAQVAVISLDSARTTTNGSTPVDSGLIIQVSGTVYGPNSYPTSNGQAFWINNGTDAGIKIYSKHVYAGYPAVHDGDQITVVGTLTDFYGSAEIDLFDSVSLDTIYQTGTSTPDTPIVILPNGLSTQTYGFLVQVNNVNMTTATGWGSTTKHYFTAKASDGLYIYVDSFTSSALFHEAQPQGIYNVVGIGDDYSTTEFNIDPRSPADFILVTTGIDNIQNTLTAAVYPNPASTKLMVSLSNDKDEPITAQMIDVTGRVVLTETKDLISGTNNLEFNIANLTNGMYILQLHTAEKSLNTKIVVDK